MKVLRSLINISLRDRQITKSVRKKYKFQDVAKWAKRRKRTRDDTRLTNTVKTQHNNCFKTVVVLVQQ